jgi:hypothetical protein
MKGQYITYRPSGRDLPRQTLFSTPAYADEPLCQRVILLPVLMAAPYELAVPVHRFLPRDVFHLVHHRPSKLKQG